MRYPGGVTLSDVPPALLAELRARHAEPQRAYHGWSHIEALLRLREELADRLCDPAAVLWAILFHDAVYDPHAADNEERSAKLLEAAEVKGLNDAARARAARLIRMTAAHAIPGGLPADETADAALFLDMDLSILGAPPERFDAYEAGIRHEYAHVPTEAFRSGRAAILRRFTERPHLYLSDWGRDRFEAAARANIARSLAKLSDE